MPIHILGSIAETTSISATSIVYTTCLIGLFLIIKTALIEGRKCTWERDWAGKFLIVVAPPSPLVYALLDHLVNLPHPPQVLYLPPIPSPLPQELLTILHAIRLSASSKAGITAAEDSATAINPESETLEEKESSVSSTALVCEPLPRNPAAIKEFMRKWAIKPPGTADDGRRIDGIVWADEWDVQRPWKIFSGGSKRKEPQGDTWAGLKHDERSTATMPSATPTWTAEQAKFHFLNSMLPFLLKAPMERSIRLINVLGPFYSAAVPLLKSTAEEQGAATAQLLQAAEPRSPIVQSGKASLRNMLLWRHLQKILNALASATHNEAVKQAAIPVPDRELGADAGNEDDASGLRQRRGGEVEPKALPIPTKRIDVQSNILALPVVVGFNRWGIVRPLLGLREGSYLGWALYLLLSPLIYLLTPSTNSALQSILYALSAPVLYDADQEDISAANNESGNESGLGDIAQAGSKARRDGVKGCGIIRDASWIPTPFLSSWADPLASKVWDQLEQQIEQGIKASEQEEKPSHKKGDRKKSVSFAET